MSLEVAVVRVFADEDGRYGNELGIVSADAVPVGNRQALATNLGFSETIFYSVHDSAWASASIYTPAAELPFAGHPTVGLAWWLRDRGNPIDTLSVPAADLTVRYADDLTWIRSKAEWAPHFEFHPVASAEDVDAADPASFASGHHYIWAWTDRDAGAIRSRMFAPGLGITEDEATGAAAVRISDRLGRSLTVRQGAGSQLITDRGTDWIELGGRTVDDRTLTICVPLLRRYIDGNFGAEVNTFGER